MSSSSSSDLSWTEGFFLPAGIVPKHYDLALVPDLENFTFQGHIYIDVLVEQSTSSVVLHSFELSYLPHPTHPHPYASLSHAAGTYDLPFVEAWEIAAVGQPNHTLTGTDQQQHKQICQQLQIHETSQRIKVDFPQPFTANKIYRLSFVFQGILNDQLCGFYRSEYTNIHGEKKFLAVTQFQACDCRRAIPCWDEPAIKATFATRLVTPPHLQAVSNMQVTKRQTIVEETHGRQQENRYLNTPKGWIAHEYAQTPIMSSYLLAFVVGEFDYISSFQNKSNVEIRVYTPPGKTHLGEFALDVANRALDFYTDFFGIPYTLPKMDLLAIPDFAAGAMENWGCVTFRDQLLLIDRDNSSAVAKTRSARVCCHEITHSWFGNLVTMHHWDNLFLNEGFARFMECYAVDHIFPDWNIWGTFATEVYGQAQILDGLETSHSVQVKVNSLDEVNEIFDLISYAKGASLIRMLHNLLGAEKFRKGLHNYLTKYSYRNTVAENLWDCLSEVSNLNINELMQEWVDRTGYPVLDIEEKTAASNPAHATGCRCFSIKQSRFLSSGKPAEEDKTLQAWKVPIVLGVHSASSDEKDHMRTNTLQIAQYEQESVYVDPSISPTDILSFNHQLSGFYRVNYSTPLLQSLCASLSLLPALDRLGILRDTFSLACAGRVPISTALDTMKFFTSEKDYAVTSALSLCFVNLLGLHSEEKYIKQLQCFMQDLFVQGFQRMGWGDVAQKQNQKEGHLDQLHRAVIIQTLGLSDHQTVVQESLRRVKLFVEDEKAHPIPADLRGPLYSFAIRCGGASARELLWSLYRRSDAEEKQRVLVAIGTYSPVDSEADVCHVMEWILSKEVRNGDLQFAMLGMGSSALGRAVAWKYIQAQWEDLASRFKGAQFVLGHILNNALNNYTEETYAAQIELFFHNNKCPGADRSIKQLIESIRMRAERLARERQSMAEWLDKHYSS